MAVKNIKLVSLTRYAENYKISRPTVYRLLEEGKITRYEGLDNEPLLNLNERPKGVRRYQGIREREKR